MTERVFRELLRKKPECVRGCFSVDLTDPISGKIKKRQTHENHVFSEALFAGVAFDWVSSVSNSWMCLNDSAENIDTTLPYLFGQTIGYGIPNTGSSGTRRGAYNSANQVLAQMSLDKVRWKFQYDFTTAQCNGEAIRTIGLTSQYFTDYNAKKPLKAFSFIGNSNETVTCDGRYTYSCSTAGIITKTDCWFGTIASIDVSAIVGTASINKTVGYAPGTGKFYIYVYSSTASARRMFVFSDNTFSTLETTYTPTAVAVSSIAAMYICGEVAYWIYNGALNTIYYANFVSNTAQQTMTVSTYNNASYIETPGFAVTGYFSGTCPINDTIIYCNSSNTASYRKGILFDISTGTVVGYVMEVETGSYANCLHPLTTEKLVCNTLSNGHKSAITAYKLDSPITKTSANGMTATYELEVFW
ncbi:hypothetical protein SDC9_64416 [bioreactor metagenome]|uniref:Uncharacterized protein n=1 Tax=bioreactor metagenome TaxID=1076179 RepID=A0A644XPF3_9ZZZZ